MLAVMPRMDTAGRAHGDIIRAIRAAQQRTQQDVADASGVDAAYLSLIELNHRRPSRPYTRKLADGLGVDVDVLTGQIPIIATLRKIADIPAGEFAEQVGITPKKLRAIEVGATVPSVELRATIARRLGVRPEVLHFPRDEDDASARAS